jgi:hypothetical protein
MNHNKREIRKAIEELFEEKEITARRREGVELRYEEPWCEDDYKAVEHLTARGNYITY